MKERDTYTDILRILAVIFVILIHTVAAQWYDLPLSSSGWKMMNALDSIARWTVPVFFMLSGAYILDPEKDISAKDIYGKYILRVLTALLFWGLLYQIYDIIDKAVYENVPFTAASLAAIPKNFIFGFPYTHLWYIYRLIGLYMLAPFIRIFIKNASKKDIEQLLILFIIVGSVIPFINTVLRQQGSSLAVSFKIVELTGFVFFYIAGYYLRKYDASRPLQIFIYAAGIAGAVITTVLTDYYSCRNGVKTEDFYVNTTPNVAAMALALFTGAKQLFGRKQFSAKAKSVITYLSSCTFGIFLVHFFFVNMSKRLGITADMINPLVCVPLIVLSVYLLSLAVISLIRLIKPLRGRII